MSSGAAWIRWDARCRNMPAHGMTNGDTHYLGLRDYVEMYPCPNGLPIDHRKPAEVPAWVDRVAKAKRDIETFNRMWAIRDGAEAITDDEFDVWLNTIAKGQNEYAHNNC